MQPNSASPIINIVIQVANEYNIFKAEWEKGYLYRAHTTIKREHNYLEDIVMNVLKKGLIHYETLSLFDSRFKAFTERFKRVMNNLEPLNQDHHKFIKDCSIDLDFVETLTTELITESVERLIK